MHSQPALSRSNILAPSTSTRLLAALLAAASVPLTAQTPPDTTPDTPPADTVTLDPVEVSATRPSELVDRQSAGTALFGSADLAHTPFSVNIITAADIKNRQAKNLIEALAGDPSIDAAFGGAGDYIFTGYNIRGFNVSNLVKDGAPVYISDPIYNTQGLEKIEVLRGPAAFRYGFLSPGGAVNLVSKRPGDTRVASVTAGVNSEGYLDAHLDHGNRYGEDRQLGVRVNLAAGGGDTFIERATQERRYLALATDYRFNDRHTLTFSADEEYARGEGQRQSGYGYVTVDSAGRLPRSFDPGQPFGQDWEYAQRYERTFGLSLDSILGDGLTLVSDLVFHTTDQDVLGVYTYDAQPNGDFENLLGGYDNHTRSLINTTYLRWETSTGAIDHDITTGFVVSRGDRNSASFFNGTAINNLYNPVAIPRPTFVLPPGRDTINRQYGVFVSDQLTIAERWHPFVGLRWSSLENYTRSATGVKSPVIKNDAITPTLGLVYDLRPKTQLYACYALGLERGGIAPLTSANFGEQLDALETDQAELGFKSEFARGYTLDGAVFVINKTAEFLDPVTNIYGQGGEQRHAGAELMLKGRLTPELQASLGGQYLDAELSGDPATSGSRPDNVPEFRVVAQFDQALPAVRGLHLLFGLTYVTEREVAVPNIAQTADAYLLFNAGLRYETRIADLPTIFRLNVDNLTDEFYYASASFNQASVGAPRLARFSVEVQF